MDRIQPVPAARAAEPRGKASNSADAGETALAVTTSDKDTGALSRTEKIDPFLAVHNAYMVAWNRAVQHGDTIALEDRLAADYQEVMCDDRTVHVRLRNRREAVEGLRELIQYSVGAVHVGYGRVVRKRGVDEMVVSYERGIHSRGMPFARFITLQTWRRRNGVWLLVRELVEAVLDN
jgi:hypothetical protein